MGGLAWVTVGRGLSQHQTIYVAELIDIHLALTSIPLLPSPIPHVPCIITILVDSCAAVKLPCTGGKLLGHFVRLTNRQVYKDLHTMYLSTTVRCQWVPGHRDVERNEWADVEAQGGVNAEKQMQEIRELQNVGPCSHWRCPLPHRERSPLPLSCLPLQWYSLVPCLASHPFRTDRSHLYAALYCTGIYPTGLCNSGQCKTRHHVLFACALYRPHLQHTAQGRTQGTRFMLAPLQPALHNRNYMLPAIIICFVTGSIISLATTPRLQKEERRGVQEKRSKEGKGNDERRA